MTSRVWRDGQVVASDFEVDRLDYLADRAAWSVDLCSLNC